MTLRRSSSLPELIAKELRNRLALGQWQEAVPGLIKLSKELGVSRETVEKAFEILTEEGCLAPAEHGKKRQVQVRPLFDDDGDTPTSPRICFMGWRPLAQMERGSREMVSELGRLARSEGVELVVSPTAGNQLKNINHELSKLVVEHSSKVWLFQGPTEDIAAWFANYSATSGIPSLAVGGRTVPQTAARIGTDLGQLLGLGVDHLAALGHRRILMPLPTQIAGGPSILEKCFRERMAMHNLPVTDYNLPIRTGSAEGWEAQLKTLFGFTPPTAVILHYSSEVAGLVGFLHRRGLRIPEDVSLIFEADEPILDWLMPDASRFVFDPARMARHLWKWVRDALDDKPQSINALIKGSFIPGKTTGPAPKGTVLPPAQTLQAVR